MLLNDVAISRQIIKTFKEKLMDCLELDVALVGAGPANLVAGFYLGRAGLKAAIFESKLAPGGGMWGGGMMFNEIVVQNDAVNVLEEMGIPFKKGEPGYLIMDSVETTSTLIHKCVSSGTPIFNLVKATDVLFRQEDGSPRVAGLVLNWSPVENLELHVDPLGIEAKFVIDGTGHPADICHIIVRKLDAKLLTKTGGVVGEMSLWADKGEEFTVANTGEVFPGLYVVGMAANNAFGGPRMGPIFGGMLLSGKKAAEMLIGELRGK